MFIVLIFKNLLGLKNETIHGLSAPLTICYLSYQEDKVDIDDFAKSKLKAKVRLFPHAVFKSYFTP